MSLLSPGLNEVKLISWLPMDFNGLVCDLQVPGFKDFQVSLLEKVWIGDLQVHQQVAARAVDVTTVTLKQENYSYFQAQTSFF